MPRLPLLAVGFVYVALCATLLPFPLVGLLHVQSSAVVAGVGFFASGLAALALFARGARLGTVLVWMTALLAIPWALLTLSLLWRPNCDYAQGLLLFAVFTLPSVGLAVALAYAVDAAAFRWRRSLFVVVGLAVAAVPVLYDLGLHPQFYTYNHVWGGVLGPIYDEELALRPGLFFFRGLTLWWAVWLVLAGRRAWLRRHGEGGAEGRRLGLGLLGASVVLVATYAAAPWLGINTPAWVTQQRLGGHLALVRFDIYYDPAAVSEGELAVIADVHRYRYAQLRETLGADVPVRIATYLYPDTETKAALTGARQTAVAPTWLQTPQVHLLQSRFDGSFAHELAHVMAREFGMPVLRASPAVGLVEGLAVAVEPPDGLPDPHAQVAAALRHRQRLGVYGDSLAPAVARGLSPWGFWGGRGAVNYTTMGSFVRYLLDEYGAEPVRAAYRSGDFQAAFGKPVAALAREWEGFILSLPEDAEALALVEARFARPSLFEQRCPHHVPPVARHLRRGNRALERGDGPAASAAFTAALHADSTHSGALAAWARLALLGSEATMARAHLEGFAARGDTLAGPAVLARLGDARRLLADSAGAEAAYARARALLPPYAHEARAALAFREGLSPEALRVFIAPDLAGVRAARLDEHAGTARGLAALLWAEAGEPARAYTSMTAVPPVSGVEAEVAAWRAAFAHASGDRAGAVALAEVAATRYLGRSAPAAAARQRDRAALAAWAQRQEEG